MIRTICGVLSSLQGLPLVPDALYRPTVFFTETPAGDSRYLAYRDPRNYLFGGSTDRADEIGWTYGLLRVLNAKHDARFRGVLAAFFVVEDDLFTTRAVSEGLGLSIGSKISAAATFIVPSAVPSASPDIPSR